MSEAIRLPISSLADAAVARAVIVRFALASGFTRRAANEVALAASELVTNIVKYAGCGELEIVDEPEGLRITALDRGPGPPSLADLFEDGVSQGSRCEPDRPITSGRGTGGGALRRLCDQVEIAERPGGGTIVCIRKRRSQA